ncbi:Ubiquitin carboxyl-terminal hydrolase family protein [Hondaea fermentalgiana]|uniref:Ubiquitin carboxyl-terminal hydrolase family protein n=1 Tax=Hondaea fermentalgiana TaxID=2315210 RepID=A0A2R5GJ03_9STRA|nr:Ubiquitin carboxyl-terminal hydrolase family protein [Hondaea fermentalgiana]|eukprot:GBG29708.1 Ubiquitin carboxyl-terminal hydrolase family protein [Hondaea fermentalgiana]
MGLEPVSARGRLVDQQDAHEFLRCFIEALMACSKKHLAHSNSASSPDGASLSVESIFDIGVRTSIRCSRCKTVSGRAESILDVSLAIANEPAGTSIVSLLDRVAETEVLQGENAYACDNCAAKVHATKTTDFVRMPRIFVLHLKRFDNSGAKIDAGVVFPETLAFKKRLHYDLRAIVVHYGRTCRSGHYTVFVRKGAVLHEDDTKSTWEEISDDVVSDAPWSRVQAQEPYLLLYERRT